MAMPASPGAQWGGEAGAALIAGTGEPITFMATRFLMDGTSDEGTDEEDTGVADPRASREYVSDANKPLRDSARVSSASARRTRKKVPSIVIASDDSEAAITHHASRASSSSPASPSSCRTPSYLLRFSEATQQEVKMTVKKSRVKDTKIKVQAQFQSHMDFKIRGMKTNFDVEEVVAKQHQRRENIALRNVFNMLDVNKDGYLCKYDVRESMASLQSPVDMEEAEIMVWEVDDSLAGRLDWPAFQHTYRRIMESKDPREPKALFTVIEFMIFDADGSGSIDVEEASTLFRRRYGKTAMEKATRLIEATIAKQDKSQRLTEAGLSYAEFMHNDGILKTLMEGSEV